MTETYFSKFPLVNYSNNSVIDITQRSKIIDTLSNNPYIFYTYIIENNERSDQLANLFYKDPYQNWLLFLSNQILDPYYGWYLSEQQFYDNIIKKYVTLDRANQLVMNYRVNWFKDQTKLSVGQFNILGIEEKKYWEINNDGVYIRKKLDWDINTNMVLRYWTSTPITANKDDLITVKIQPSSIGTSSIVKSTIYQDKSYVIVQHVSGDAFEHDTITLNSNSYIIYDGVNVPITKIDVINTNIQASEYKYWEPVTAFTMELEKNEYNKALKVLDPTLIPKAIKELKSSLNG